VHFVDLDMPMDSKISIFVSPVPIYKIAITCAVKMVDAAGDFPLSVTVIARSIHRPGKSRSTKGASIETY
jgi:hypothetical protein